jgi:hypothetical protein
VERSAESRSFIPLHLSNADAKKVCAKCQPSSRASRDALEKKSEHPINRGHQRFAERKCFKKYKVIRKVQTVVSEKFYRATACHAQTDMTGSQGSGPNGQAQRYDSSL